MWPNAILDAFYGPQTSMFKSHICAASVGIPILRSEYGSISNVLVFLETRFYTIYFLYCGFLVDVHIKNHRKQSCCRVKPNTGKHCRYQSASHSNSAATVPHFTTLLHWSKKHWSDGLLLLQVSTKQRKYDHSSHNALLCFHQGMSRSHSLLAGDIVTSGSHHLRQMKC